MLERGRSLQKAVAPVARHYLLALLLPLLLYARTIDFDYVHADDVDLIARNQAFLHDLGNVPRAFARSYFETDDILTDLKTYYRPATIVSFMLDAQRGGDDPRAYHATNVALHAVVSVLLMPLAKMWGASPRAALAAALIFAAHPVNVQAVAWIAARNDLLLAVFGLLSLIAWARGDLAQRYRAAWIVVHVLAFALALFSKETGIFFPAIAVLHQRVARRERLSRAQRVGLGADGIIALAWASLRADALAGSPGAPPVEMMRIAVMNSSQVLVQAGKLLAPVRLNVSPGVDSTGLVLGGLAIVVLGWVAIRFLPRGLAIVSVFWVLAFLLPTLVVRGLPAYEHRNYLPLLGVLLTFSVFRLTSQATGTQGTGQGSARTRQGRLKHRPTAAQRASASVAVASVVVAIFAIQTYARQEVFRDPFAYWTDATHDGEFAPFAHINLGQLHEGAGRPQEARREYLRALEIDPATPKGHNNLGVVLMKLNEPQRALWHFREEVRQHPSNAEAWFNLGLAAEQRGNVAEARRHYERAISENNRFVPAYEKLGLSPPVSR